MSVQHTTNTQLCEKEYMVSEAVVLVLVGSNLEFDKIKMRLNVQNHI